MLLWAVRRPGQAVTMNTEAAHALACVSEDVRVNLTTCFPGRWMDMHDSHASFPKTALNLHKAMSLLER